MKLILIMIDFCLALIERFVRAREEKKETMRVSIIENEE